MNAQFKIICGEKVDHPNVVFRKAIGKWDAINYSASLIPDNSEIVIFNDVDNKIFNLRQALNSLNNGIDIIYCRILVPRGPQLKFYRLIDPLRRLFNVAANGDLMIVRRKVLEKILPVPPCIAEDSYLLFRALELGYKAKFSTATYVTTEKSANAALEETYKVRTTLGIYQALQYTKPPVWIRVFYLLLPLMAPILLISGEDGRAWTKGIEKAVNARIKKFNPTKF